jgi:peptide deformylase
MSVQEIRLFGDPVLTTPAAPVIDFDKELRKLVQDLTDTMVAAPGGRSADRGSIESLCLGRR